MPAPRTRPRLRKREVILAVAAGGVAAAMAAAILDDDNDGAFGGRHVVVMGSENDITYDLADFDEISTSGPQDVVITTGDHFSVQGKGSAEALALLKPVVRDGKLTIEPRSGFNWGGWGRLSGATYYITLPRLSAVALAGSGDITVDKVEGDSFVGTVAGAGSLSIAQMHVDEADFRIGGSGDVTASGTAQNTRVSIGGAGEVRAGGLRSKSASVSIGGAGDVALTADDKADVSIAGAGDVVISGTARCSVTRFGVGDVQCAGGGGTDD